MLRVLMIGGFGFIGTIARYLAQGVVQRLSGGTFPYGTLAVNVLGSFLVGLAATLFLLNLGIHAVLGLAAVR